MNVLNRYNSNKIGAIYVLIFTILFFTNCSTNRATNSIVPENRIMLHNNDTLIQFFVRPVNKTTSFEITENKYYTWYRADSLHTTKGQYNSKLLEGEYLEFFPGKNLKQKGFFKNGLKDGKWYTWYKSGETASIIIWTNGLRTGLAEFFSQDGKVVKRGIYKDDKEEGIFEEITSEGKSKQIIYRSGVIVTDSLLIKQP